jgi:glycosyltransferase involved in cell wall biosynthesis
MLERSTKSYASRSPSVSDERAPLLVCFSHLRWDFVWQRPQHLLSRAAKHYRVLVVEEPIFKPGIAPHMDISQRPQGVTVAVPMLPEGLDPADIILEQRELIEGLLDRQPIGPRVFWYYTPMAMAFSSHLECDLCVYDNMDELSLFRGASRELLDLESALFSRADLVFTGGMSLYEAKRNRHRSVHAFPSSIDFDHFAKARSIAQEPGDQATIPHPRLGFFGVIDERMDYALLSGVAAARPDWHLVLVGPTAKVDPASLPHAANIHYLGAKSYAELPDYIAGWDVAMLPFARNEATRFISPTKTPEYLAAGKPVVSTSIRDVVRPYGQRGLARIADSVPAFVDAVDAALADDPIGRLRAADAFLTHLSWDGTWLRMRQLVEQAIADRKPRRVTDARTAS